MLVKPAKQGRASMNPELYRPTVTTMPALARRTSAPLDEALAAHARLVEALRATRPFGHPVYRVETIETHISTVLLAGEFAYKIKKPVDLGFVDFTTLEKRRRS